MNYYKEIKEELINNEIYKKSRDYANNYYKNRHDLNTYYNVGKLLSDAGKHYGEGIIKEFSKKLTIELEKNFNTTLLKRIRQFYLLIKKGATLSHQLNWSHYCELLPLNNIYEIEYYIKISEEKRLSVRELRESIKSKEYERLENIAKNKLKLGKKNEIGDFIKHPIQIKNTFNIDVNKINEESLKITILNNLEDFLQELGNGYSFIKSEYKIKIGNSYNYIDILLFNYIYNCFVVIELKVTELKSEHIGQIIKYMNCIDELVNKNKHNKTIGIIITLEENKFIMHYCDNDRIFNTKYILN